MREVAADETLPGTVVSVKWKSLSSSWLQEAAVKTTAAHAKCLICRMMDMPYLM